MLIFHSYQYGFDTENTGKQLNQPRVLQNNDDDSISIE
jgi:hypothetical protein